MKLLTFIASRNDECSAAPMLEGTVLSSFAVAAPLSIAAAGEATAVARRTRNAAILIFGEYICCTKPAEGLQLKCQTYEF